MDNYFKQKNILITGGLGFLGSSLAQRLVQHGANVTLLDNLNPMYGGNVFNAEAISNKIAIIINDVRNSEILTPLIQSAHIIYHMAAQVSYIDSLHIPFEDLDLNARATLNILEIHRRNDCKAKIIFLSSRMIYGKSEQSLITESSPTNPLSLYGIHKLASENYLLMYHRNFGTPVTVLRITNPYGPRQQIKHSKYSLIGWFVRQAIEGKTIQIFGEGKQFRDYIFVDDLVEAMLRCSEASDAVGEVINVGTGVSTRFCDMASTVVKKVGSGVIEFIPWPANYENVETGDIAVDISKLRRITAWQPSISLEDGVQETFAFYKKNFDRYVGS
jgi:UDP-glucose 4-epimerase